MFAESARRNRVVNATDDGEKSDVELALHRHRPDMLQRTDRFAGAQVA